MEQCCQCLVAATDANDSACFDAPYVQCRDGLKERGEIWLSEDELCVGQKCAATCSFLECRLSACNY